MSITSRINEMSSHIDQAYDELQGLGADLTNVNKNIENISMVLDDIYDSMPQVSGEGTSLTLDDTRVGKIKSTLKGNTSQSGTPTPTSPIPVNVVSGDNEINVCGKNSYNINANYDWIGANTNYTITDNTINVNGKYFVAGLHSVKSNTDYTISATRQIIQDNSSCGTIRVFTPDKSQMLGEGKTTFTFNTGNNNQVYVLLYAGLNEQGNVDFSNIQLEQGSSASSYLPYSGNTYNIDLPVENLFDSSLFTNGTTHGITLTKNNDGTITLNGTSTARADFTIIDLFSLKGNDKISSISKKSGTTTGNVTFGIYDSNWTNGKQCNITSSSGMGSVVLSSEITYTKCFIRIESGITLSNLTIALQIEKGSKQNNFTPYGTTPIELAEISTYNDEIFRTSGKNLFNSNITPENYYYDNNGEKVYQSGVEYINQEINNVNYTSITISFLSSTGGASVRVCEYNLSGAFITRTLVNTNNQVVNLNNATTKIILSVNSDSNSYFTYLMINKGSSATDYEPYGVGKWYLHKEIGKIDISNYNNTEPAGAWSGFEPNGNICMVYNNTGVKITPIRNDVLSNKFAPQAESMWNGMRVGIQSYANDSKIVIGTTIAEVEEYAGTTLNVNNYIGYFKTYIISLKPDIYIILANPTTEEITYQPLIDQLNLLEKAMSYNGQTNISQVNNDLPFIISASALKEWQESASLNNTLSMVNPLSLGNTLNTQENDIQPIEVDNIEPLEEEENEES